MRAEEFVDDFLEHYGVKGMKWGVRRSRAQLAAARDRRASKKRTLYQKGAKDAPKNLTDDELKTRINRMETEKRYNDLNSRTVSTGEKLASEVITNAGKGVATKALAGGLTLAVGAAVGAKFGDDAAKVFQKGKR